MIQWRRHWPWLALALAVMVIAVAALWLSGIFPGRGNRSFPETGASPLLTPTPLSTSDADPSFWTSAGAILLWATLGLVLSLGIAFIFVRRYHPAE
jgi:hypothetical protein